MGLRITNRILHPGEIGKGAGLVLESLPHLLRRLLPPKLRNQPEAVPVGLLILPQHLFRLARSQCELGDRCLFLLFKHRPAFPMPLSEFPRDANRLVITDPLGHGEAPLTLLQENALALKVGTQAAHVFFEQRDRGARSHHLAAHAGEKICHLILGLPLAQL
ncbi:hypothetical protein BH23GEM8_BH23GEM8_08980 [soil metagenome]